MKQSWLILLVSILLVSCGGGGSSSEPSGTIYIGSQTGTLAAQGVTESLGVLPFRMIVGADDSVFITDTGEPPIEATGLLSDGRFSAVSDSRGTIDGIACQFDWTYRGSIEGNTVSGLVIGNVTCSDGETRVVSNLQNSSFSGTTGNSKVSNNESGVLGSVVQVVK